MVTDAPVVASWDGSDDELLDAREVTALLTVKASTLLAWAREERVPCIRLAPRHPPLDETATAPSARRIA
jgi:hypothetical protein